MPFAFRHYQIVMELSTNLRKNRDPGGINKASEADYRSWFIIRVSSYLYMIALTMFLFAPAVELIASGFTKRPVPYRMEFPYSLDDRTVYLITYIYTALIGAACVGTTLAQQTLLTMLVRTSSRRFCSLHHELQNIFEKTAMAHTQGPNSISNDRHTLFRIKLYEIIEKQCSLIR